MSGLIPRHVAAQVGAALSDTRVVLITGARQAGKSTLVKVVAGDRLAERRDLDRAQDRAAAITDPVGFVDSVEPLVIDEIQRVPELLLAIKAPVDDDPRPGRYLLTGSSHLFGMIAAPDALPGRMETVELWPLSQGEIDGDPTGSWMRCSPSARIYDMSRRCREPTTPPGWFVVACLRQSPETSLDGGSGSSTPMCKHSLNATSGSSRTFSARANCVPWSDCLPLEPER
jgi:hypothetical protein